MYKFSIIKLTLCAPCTSHRLTGGGPPHFRFRDWPALHAMLDACGPSLARCRPRYTSGHGVRTTLQTRCGRHMIRHWPIFVQNARAVVMGKGPGRRKDLLTHRVEGKTENFLPTTLSGHPGQSKKNSRMDGVV